MRQPLLMELFRTLGALIEAPSPDLHKMAAVLEIGPLPEVTEHTELFLFELYPYASVYLGAEGMLGGEARDRIAGFWRALSLAPPAEPDHLAVMLALYAELGEREKEGDEAARTRWRRAREAYLWEHLVSWLPGFLDKLGDLASPFYRRWGALAQEALTEETARLGREEILPLHLREAPGLPDPREGNPGAFLDALLSPVRSGLILVRSDLARGARELGLGLRMGERKYALKALLSQDSSAILGWLAREAVTWAERHRGREETLGPVSRFWAARAEATAALAGELRSYGSNGNL